MKSADNIMKSCLKAFEKMEEWVLVLVLLSLAFLTSAQVICRYALGFSFVWMDEISRYLSVFIAFLGAAIGTKVPGLIFQWISCMKGYRAIRSGTFFK